MTMGVSNNYKSLLNMFFPFSFSSIAKITSQEPFIVLGLELICNCTKECVGMQDVEMDAKLKYKLQRWSEQEPTLSGKYQNFFQGVSVDSFAHIV